jgi:hypothetical protein
LAAEYCFACGVPFSMPPPPRRRARRPAPESNLRPPHQYRTGKGGVLILLLVGVGAIYLISKYQMIPVLRGIQLDLPLICVLGAALLVVLWAGKFLDVG